MSWFKPRRFEKRKDVRCTYCLTKFRVYGNVEASNSPYTSKYGRRAHCPRCRKECGVENSLRRVKDIIPE
jgi:hypothetical protein